MDTDFQFPGIALTITPKALRLYSQTPLKVLSSAVAGGGYVETHTIINWHVNKTYTSDDPASDLAAFAQEHVSGEPFVGLMTAAWMRNARSVTLQEGEISVAAVATAGLSNAAAAGLTPPFETLTPGTINLILLINANLTLGAMVNAVMTATEAKTAVLHERRVLTAAGEPATGTSTDAIVIACTGRGEELPYAGSVTPLGYLIGRCVRAVLPEALDAT